MLREFENWFKTVQQEIENLGYKIEKTNSSTVDDECVYVDLDSETLIARITLWNLNECSLQIIEVNSEALIFHQYSEINSSTEFDNNFAPFFKVFRQKKL
jgi:hypothetical protein